MTRHALYVLALGLAACRAPQVRPERPHLITAQIRSLAWSVETPVRVSEKSLAEDDGSLPTVARVTVKDVDLLKGIQERWYNPTPAMGKQSSDFDMRFIALLRFDDGTVHRMALDWGCSTLFLDGRAHELDVTLGKRLVASLPDNHQLIFKEWSPASCSQLCPKQ